MECAVCKDKVEDFKLQLVSPSASKPPSQNTPRSAHEDSLYPSFVEFDSGIGLLPSAFNGSAALRGAGFSEYDDFIGRAQGASTPVAEHRSPIHGAGEEAVVLRIDNVPWVRPISFFSVLGSCVHPSTRIGYHASCDCYVDQASGRARSRALGSQG